MENSNREEMARFAAVRMLFGHRTSGYGSLENSGMSSVGTDVSASSRWCKCSHLRTMGAARRTFCLLVAFDLLLSFILWGLHVKIRQTSESTPNNTYNTSMVPIPSLFLAKSKPATLADIFYEEVVNYSIQRSLFDTFICSLIRFLSLTLAYAMCNLRNPSVIAVTTFLTCVFVIIKIFTYKNFEPVAIVILVCHFVIAWIETFLLDFRVLPEENANSISQGSGILPSVEGGAVDSPFHTPQEGSEVSSPLAETSSYEDSRMWHIAVDNWRKACGIINIKDGWKHETSTIDMIHVYSQPMEKLGKMLRVEARIDASPEDVYKVTSVQYEQSSRWNKTVLECRVLQVLDSDTDVTYNVVAAAGGGTVSSRDFVTVRHCRRLDDADGTRLSAACAVEHAHKPADRRYVRGENRMSAFMYRKAGDSEYSCQLSMYVSIDIKGWIPQVAVDKALTGVLVEFVRCLRKRLRDTCSYQGGACGPV